KGLPAVPKLFFGFVDVRDVAELQVKAMETPAAGGKRFLASAGTLSLLQAANIVRPAFPAYAAKLPRYELPDWLVRLLTPFDRRLAGNVGLLGLAREADASAGEALLGRKFIPAAEAIRAMATSLIAQKLV